MHALQLLLTHAFAMLLTMAVCRTAPRWNTLQDCKPMSHWLPCGLHRLCCPYYCSCKCDTMPVS
jgi:hypothetical protein